jgi:hypothetical protein
MSAGTGPEQVRDRRHVGIGGEAVHRWEQVAETMLVSRHGRRIVWLTRGNFFKLEIRIEARKISPTGAFHVEPLRIAIVKK